MYDWRIDGGGCRKKERGTATSSMSGEGREVVRGAGACGRTEKASMEGVVFFKDGFRDVFLGRVLSYVDYVDFKSLRRLCKGAWSVFEDCRENGLVGSFWSRTVVKLYPDEVNDGIGLARRKRDFAVKHGLGCKLSAENDIFIKMLLLVLRSKKVEFGEGARKVEVLQVGNIGWDKKYFVFKNVMEELGKRAELFPALKCLRMGIFMDLSNVIMPIYIESLEVGCYHVDYGLKGLGYLKTILLKGVWCGSSIEVEGLGCLESLTVEGDSRVKILVDYAGCPKLGLLRINGEEMVLDKREGKHAIVFNRNI